jgi:hypothetical protein
MFHNILTRITNRFQRHSRGLVWPVAALLASLGWLAGCTISAPTYRSTDSGFKDLFDGQTLNGWMQVDQKGAGYGVTNGVIFCAPGSGGNLLTEAEYENFILYFEFKLEEGSNNGLGIRTPRAGDPAYLGMEIQILDDVAADKGKWGKLKPDQFHGSVYGVVPAERGALNPPGEWNRQVVIANGRQIKVVLNDITILDTNLNDITDPAKIAKHPGLFRDRGHLGFLGHNDYVEFRNIRIKELPDNESSNTAPEGFTSMFNGKDLTGWKGLVVDPGWKGLAGDPRARASMSAPALAAAQAKADELAALNWRVEDGALVYRGTNYDNLVSARDYVNFELLAEWKIEPLADSGLYLRGSPQVQIWDPFTPPIAAGNEVGSGGLFNNKTNASKPLVVADRPIGEWNQFRIIMAGDRVHVFLNGELVVNGVPLENYWQRDLPVLAYGPIELQAHKTVVWFKNLYVRELHAAPR